MRNWSADLGEPKPRVPVIVGPTAVGKTSVALALRNHWPLVVISADSRQVYRGLDVGTAKPTPEQLRLVPHCGIDVVDPGVAYSAGRFAADAIAWISEVPDDQMPVVVGGTGLYIRALAEGIFAEPELGTTRREAIRRWATESERVEQFAYRLDPEFKGGGQQRASRVVEVALLTGRPLSWWQVHSDRSASIQPWYIRLTLAKVELHRRIDERVRKMIGAGLLEEVEQLLASGVKENSAGLDAVGYREVVWCLRGDFARSELADRIGQSTRQYAKRQETWFRHQLGSEPVAAMEMQNDPEGVASEIAELWEKREQG